MGRREESCATQNGAKYRIDGCLRKMEKKMQELSDRGDGMEEMVERLTERVESPEESKRRTVGAREKVKSTKVLEESVVG